MCCSRPAWSTTRAASAARRAARAAPAAAPPHTGGGAPACPPERAPCGLPCPPRQSQGLHARCLGLAAEVEARGCPPDRGAAACSRRGADAGGPRAQIADFGLARVLQDNATHVSTKSFGTVAYMPAEVLQHNRMSRGADVYSFAMIMWELLAGRRVYEGYIATQARADLTLP